MTHTLSCLAGRATNKSKARQMLMGIFSSIGLSSYRSQP